MIHGDENFKQNPGIGIHNGVPGTILLLASDYLLTDEPKNREKIDEGSEFCLENIKGQNNIHPIWRLEERSISQLLATSRKITQKTLKFQMQDFVMEQQELHFCFEIYI